MLVDNQNAAFLAHELAEIPGLVIDPLSVETNILRFEFDAKTKRRLKTDYVKFVGRLKEEEKILCNAGFANDNIRFVTHRDVSRKQCE